jgi:patatin-like phospholipase/acyl hydrolase
MTFQVLSLSGGGFLGLYSAAVLAELEEINKRSITSSFDLLAGTSIGGIVVLGLAAGSTASQIKSALEETGQKIFGSRPAATSKFGHLIDIAQRAFSSKYDTAVLRETIESIVGRDKRIGELNHAVLIPSINLSRGSPQIFKTPHHKDFRLDLNLKVVDVALATSAAPTYFPLAKIGDTLFADGGLYANSPDLLALHEATHFFKASEESVHLLSIGTTTSKFSFGHTQPLNFGIKDWFMGQRLMNAIIASQQQSADFMVRHRLGDRYVRLDAVQSKEQELMLGLDVATDEAQKTIKALASSTVRENVNNSALQQMLGNQAKAVKFHYKVSVPDKD